MARDYTKYVGRSHGLYLSRKNLMFVGFVALVLASFQLFRQPTWLVQRLEAPNGERTAVLKRKQYFEHYFKVQAKEGTAWRTIYNSPALTNGYQVDLRERLFWHPNSTRLYFTVKGHMVMGYDFELGRHLTAVELGADQIEFSAQLAR